MVLAVGKVKERFYKEALVEYAKRLSAYIQLEIVEVADEPSPESPSPAEIARVQDAEGQHLVRHLRDRDGIILLDITGRAMDSVAWSIKYESLCAESFGRLVFVIGGSHGIAAAIRQRAHFRWSFGPLTLPHQLARVVLLEQLYRGVRIARGEPYHK